jgi:hypothetical protein
MWLATDTFDKSWKMPDIEMVKQQWFWAPHLPGLCRRANSTSENFALAVIIHVVQPGCSKSVLN